MNGYAFATIKALLSDNYTRITTLLDEPDIVDCFSSSFGGCRKFFANNIKELLNMILVHPLDNYGVKVWILFTIKGDELLTGALKPKTFNPIISKTLQGPVTAPVLTRICTLTEQAFENLPELAVKYIQFLPLLISYLEVPAVLYLFERIFASTNPEVMDYLTRIDFPSHIIGEFQKINFAYQGTNTTIEKLNSIYRFISAAVFRQELIVNFLSVLDFLHPEIPNAPSFLKNSRWFAVFRFAKEAALPQMIKFIPDALEIIETQQGQIEYQVMCLKFIIRMIGYKQNIPITRIASRLIIWAEKFPHLTFLHREFRRFIGKAVNDFVIADFIVRTYTPILIRWWRENQGLLRILAYDILNFFEKNAELMGCLCETEYPRVADGEMKSYRNKIEKDFGGKKKIIAAIPATTAKSDD